MPSEEHDPPSRTAQLCAALTAETPSIASAAARAELAGHLAAATAAADDPRAVRVRTTLSDRAGEGAATVPGTEERLDVIAASQATAYAAAIGGERAGSACFGAGLAMGEARELTLADVAAAYAVGRECQLRLAPAIDAGWDGEGAAGALGAAAAAAHIAGLGDHGIEQALGIAASETLGLLGDEGTDLFDWHPAKAAANGVLAALLTEHDFTSPADVLDTHRGVLEVIGRDGASPSTDAAWLLGEHTAHDRPSLDWDAPVRQAVTGG